MREKLSQNVIEENLNKLIENLEIPWLQVENTLVKEFVFKDFIDAFGFMTKVAIIAQVMDHHPVWSNVYNKVKIELSTHDVGGISKLDFELAEKIEAKI